jgi:hypothetical protein
MPRKITRPRQYSAWTTSRFVTVAERLFGDDWRRELAALYGVDRSTVRRYAAVEGSIPLWMEVALKDRMAARGVRA